MRIMSCKKVLISLFTLFACALTAITSGCASGGFKLTRQYARWVNSQMIILRVILYIVTLPIYGITMLIDMVIFNTMDFWNGTVAAGAYQYKQDGKNYFVKHEFQPGTQLKKSTIEVKNQDLALLQTMVLQETPSGEIEFFVDGKLRTKVTDIASFPVATLFGVNGEKLQEEAPLLKTSILAARALARQ